MSWYITLIVINVESLEKVFPIKPKLCRCKIHVYIILLFNLSTVSSSKNLLTTCKHLLLLTYVTDYY